MKEIPLTKGMVALVDDCDYARISQYNWHVVENSAHNENRKIYYARRWERTDQKRENGTSIYKAVYMQREVMGLDPHSRELIPDHLDYDGLNCTRANLQVKTFSDNLKRKRPQQSKKKEAA